MEKLTERKQENIIVGQKLQEYRLSRGITQNQIAESLGVARSRYVDYERGKCKIPLEMILKLSNVFRITPNRLYEILGMETSQVQGADLLIMIDDFVVNINSQNISFNDRILSDEEKELFINLIHIAFDEFKKGI